MASPLKIGTRESELAVWQATQVKTLLQKQGLESELIFITSEGDVDLVTPLYEMGVQGIFTKTLDAALLSKRIDLAVHSLKDVPTQLPPGIKQAAVLERGSYKDLLVFKEKAFIETWQLALAKVFLPGSSATLQNLNVDQRPPAIATSSIRRKAQWLHRYPGHNIENLRGNINTRLRKVYEMDWDGAIFAAAGLERIHIRPENSIELHWMLPAPAQGAIAVVCREDDDFAYDVCQQFNHPDTALCTKIERDFLRGLLGGCSTPISALAEIEDGKIFFKGNIYSPDGRFKEEIATEVPVERGRDYGAEAAREILQKPVTASIIQQIVHAKG